MRKLKGVVVSNKMSRTSPNEVRQDVRGSRPSATDAFVAPQMIQFGDNGIHETVIASIVADGFGTKNHYGQ